VRRGAVIAPENPSPQPSTPAPPQAHPRVKDATEDRTLNRPRDALLNHCARHE
jgi:hypothetical protein